MKQKKILFIGGGNMTRAIVTGLIADGYHSNFIYVVDRNKHKRDYFKNTLRVNTDENINQKISEMNIIVLAVKPQAAHAVCTSMKENISNQFIISIMAGVTTQTLLSWLGSNMAIVRAMPNTPATIREGATGLFANQYATETEKKCAEKIMGSIGITAWLNDEAQINMITALFGSGPAYYFYFIEIMQNIAKKNGIPEEIANQFALQTAFGAAKLALDSTENCARLRERVTSKNGTTDAAIRSMQESDLYSVLEKALLAAENRSVEISRNTSIVNENADIK